jgi:hypothetical protein
MNNEIILLTTDPNILRNIEKNDWINNYHKPESDLF